MNLSDNNDQFEILDKKFSESYLYTHQNKVEENLDFKKKPFIQSFGFNHPLSLRAEIIAQDKKDNFPNVLISISNLLDAILNKKINFSFISDQKTLNSATKINFIEEIPDLIDRNIDLELPISNFLKIILHRERPVDNNYDWKNSNFCKEVMAFELFLNLYLKGLMPLKKVRSEKIESWKKELSMVFPDLEVLSSFHRITMTGEASKILKAQLKLINKDILFENNHNQIELYFSYCFQDKSFQKLLSLIR